MTELWTRTPLQQDILEKIQRFVGGINTESWPGIEKYPSFSNALQGTKEKSKIKNLDRYLRDENGLVEQLLTLRITVLDHDFFWTDPMPCSQEETLSKLLKSLFDFTESLPQQMNAQHSAAKKPAFTRLIDRVF